MSEILFGQSYYLRFDPKLWEAMQPYPPLGTLYAASLLRERGYAVALFDAMLAESEAEWQQALEREQPRFAVIYEDNFNYLSKMCLLRMRQAAFTMITMAKAHGCTVIVGGSDASDHAEAYHAAGADFVLIGEGDATLAELIDRLAGRTATRFEDILGLAWAGGQAARRPDIKDLDALPFPAWDLVDTSRYRQLWQAHHGFYSMNMVTTRGCPYHCNWCAKPIWGQRYNVRSPEHVAAELAWLKRTYAPDHIWFADDILGLKPGWLSRFADLVEQHDARVPFKCLSRADLLLRPGTIEGLARAGCQIVWLGAESGSQQVLNAMEKGTTVEQIYEVARRLRQAGVRVGFFLQFGYPGETRADIELTLKMVRDCQPDDIGMSVSYPLPGTPFYERVRGQIGTQRNWRDSDDLAMLYDGPYPTAFYRQLYVVLHKQFRSRKYRDELLALRHPRELTRQRLRQAAKLAFYTASLPLERWRLDRITRQPHRSLAPIAPKLDLEAAAMPSPQVE
ncbi:MAG: B12-binding domain-containing radical SAM protein [Roseiflexaceae bacterium]|nr:B12-binding domain-containing radical SAM protein [Roseiflexaceae bacterium]